MSTSLSSTFPRLQVDNLSAELPGETGPHRILDAIALALNASEIVDLTGPSGSGKSTLLRALARLLPEATGQLRLDGVSAEEIHPTQWRAQVALLGQKPAILPGTIRENLLAPWKLKIRVSESIPGEDQLREHLHQIGLEDIALERDSARLSVGQQARIAFCRVLLTSPKVLLLDEPDAALDDATSAAMSSLLRSRHRASDGLATRRFHIEHGHIKGSHIREVAP
jgi:putative ABC transport system ATP-binding protein